MAFLLNRLVLSLSLIDTALNTKNEIFIGRKIRSWFAQSQGSYCKPKAEADSPPFSHLPLFLPHPGSQLREEVSHNNLLLLTERISKNMDFEWSKWSRTQVLKERKAPTSHECKRVYLGKFVPAFFFFFFSPRELMWYMCCGKTRRLEWFGLQELQSILRIPPGAG